MKNTIIYMALACILPIIMFSCTKDDTNPASPLDGLTKLDEGYAIGASAKVEIWGTKNYFAGYNNLTVVLYDSLNMNQKITDAHINFMPMMTMDMGTSTMTHSAPVENPGVTAVDDVFPGAIIFQMPTISSGAWSLSIEVHNHKYDKEGEADFDISVDNPTESSVSSFVSQSADSSSLILAMLNPEKFKVGMNDIEFTINRKTDMMDFPYDDTYAIEITPEMPSMGHGSPNNVNPENIGNGHYKGQVNFTMTGMWRIHVTVKKNDVTISPDTWFDVTLH